MKLTPKQQAFADYYIELGNATEAAVKAGYSKKTAAVIGAENLTKPYIKSYIDNRMNELQSNRIASQEEILHFLTNVVRGELTEEVPVLVGDGVQELVDKDIGIKDRLKAAELLGKRYFMWSNKEVVDIEKVKADTEFVKERTKLLKGVTKDTSLLEALIGAVKGDGS